MNGTHPSDGELIDLLYAGAPDRHVGECAECEARWNRLLARRERILGIEAEIPPALLAAQRNAIRQRISGRDPERLWGRMAAAFAVPAALAVGLLIAPRPATPPAAAVSDAQLLAEVAELVETAEPRATAPLRELFEEATP